MQFVLLLIVGKWFLLMFICLFDDANELSDEIMSILFINKTILHENRDCPVIVGGYFNVDFATTCFMVMQITVWF